MFWAKVGRTMKFYEEVLQNAMRKEIAITGTSQNKAVRSIIEKLLTAKRKEAVAGKREPNRRLHSKGATAKTIESNESSPYCNHDIKVVVVIRHV